MKKSNVRVVLIVDKSGSMAKLTNDTIGGFNAYLDGLEGDPRVSALLFDTTFKVLFRDKIPAKATRLDTKNYQANGGTALYDAVGKTLEELEFPEGDKVLCVITTDGEENSSHEFTAAKIKEAVGKAEESGWSFIYLGADANAWKGSGAMGINPMYTYSTLSQTGAHEKMKYHGITCATNSFTVSASAGEAYPIAAAAQSYATSTAPITTTYTEVVNKKVWSDK